MEDTSIDLGEVIEETGAEEQEFAETADEGAEEPEVAEPDVKSDADSAFAELRRRAEAYEKENKALQEALGLYFDGETPDELVVKAHAYESGRSEEEIRAELESRNEFERLSAENELLRQQNENYQASRMAEEDLREIQSIDPDVKSLDDLGPNFYKYIERGLRGKEAYAAYKALTEMTKVIPPKAPGKVNEAPDEKDYFSPEEVDAMSEAEVDKNYDAIRKSMERW